MSPVQLDWDFKTRASFTVLWSYFTLSYPHEPSLLYNDSMKIPKRIIPLVEDGVIDEVLRQLMSGKEATVYVVRCGDEIRCAKVYKEAAKRSFKQAVEY